MNSPLLNIAIVLALILLEACFVASEIALISLREGQVRAMAERGRRGQAVARLVKYPNRFLATVQIGVTLTALLSSAFGAVTLSDQAKDALVRLGMAPGLAGVLGFIGVTLIISFVTLVVGELVPKRLGLQRPVATAALFSPTLNRVAAICRPIIWLLSRSTDALVRVLGGDPSTGREAISEEELRGLVAAHESLSTDERRLIDDVFEAYNAGWFSRDWGSFVMGRKGNDGLYAAERLMPTPVPDAQLPADRRTLAWQHPTVEAFLQDQRVVEPGVERVTRPRPLVVPTRGVIVVAPTGGGHQGGGDHDQQPPVAAMRTSVHLSPLFLFLDDDGTDHPRHRGAMERAVVPVGAGLIEGVGKLLVGVQHR